MRASRMPLRWLAATTLLVGLCSAPAPGYAGTVGKITGMVKDTDGQPIVAATITVVDQRLGAYSAEDGRYSILQVPAGTYSLRVTRLGYEPVRVDGIVVSSDQTTTQDVTMASTDIQTEEVVVTAERPPVELNLTSSKATLTTEEIEKLPVENLEDVVNLQAGVVDGHFRGGRQGEVQYQVDGVSVNNAYDNSSTVNVDRSLLQEVQVISGTFDAEYGQAMSGVVNAVLKDGTEDFRWNAEVYTGAFVFAGQDRLAGDQIRPGDIQNYQATLSGPLPLANTVYLLNGRRNVFHDYLYGTRRFVPTDEGDFEDKVFEGSGDGDEVALGYSKEWSGILKLSNSSLRNTRLDYQALVNFIDGRRTNWAFRYNPDGLSEQQTFSISHGVDITQTLSETSYLDFSFRQNYLEYEDYAYEDVFDSRYDAAGPPRTDFVYEPGAVIQGVEFTRFKQMTNAYLFKSVFVTQLTSEHQMKMGGELNLPRVAFGTPGHLVYATEGGQDETLVRHINEPPDYPGVNAYYPFIAAGFVQEQTELDDLTLRAGLRLDYFDARATIPSDLANPANSIAGAPESVPQATTEKVSLSPRLGVAYPIEGTAAIHFAYGHFRQWPAIGQVFSNADYDILSSLQAGESEFGVMGNPDVKPETTIQYEIGYKQSLGPDLGADLTVFYKDIRDLLGVEFLETYNGAEYARLTNVDFGSVLGFTLSLDHRRLGPVSLSLDYTWQQALGNASNPRETAVRAAAQEDPRPRLVFFDWDQRHTFNLTAALDRPGDYGLSAVLRAGSGQPYTPVIDSGFNAGLVTNSGRKPAGMVLDLRAEKSVRLFGRDASLFTRVFNALDTRYFNGAVFSSTGSPYYSRFTESDREALADPTRFYAPRRIEIGIRMGSEGW